MHQTKIASKGTPVKQVKSAVRTMALFSVFAEEVRPMTLGELAERMAAPKSSCYELLHTLIDLGFITVLDNGKAYYPARRLSDMVDQINRFNPIKEKIEAELKALRNLTGETVLIGRLQGSNVVYSEVFDGTHTIRYTARPGELKDIHASALGKALLAGLDDKSRDELISTLQFDRYNEHTITNAPDLYDNLSDGMAQGIYVTEGEHQSEVMAIACPLQVRGHQLAIGMAGPMSRMKAHFGSYSRALTETVERIGA